MEKLDQTYLRELVVRAREGSSNAFAELFTATCGRVHAYLLGMLREESAAAEALETVYAQALGSLMGLQRPDLFLPWCARMCLRQCMEASGAAGEGTSWLDRTVALREGTCTVRELWSLPLVESQTLLMSGMQGMSPGQIGDILNLSRGVVRRHLRSGRRHLVRTESLRPGEGEGAGFLPVSDLETGAPGPVTRSRILGRTLEACGRDAHTVPMEALSAYVVYRRERFSLQRGVTAAALILFLLLPLLFTLPKVTVSVADKGERGLPVYTVDVRSLLPVYRVTARLRSHALPVYEASARQFTVEPTRNGNLTVTVELVNRQGVETRCTVTAVDARGPELGGSEIGTDTVLLYVEDAGIGVDFHEIYALDGRGLLHYPLETDSERGTILFPFPEEDWDVYIPDHIGNTLHIRLIRPETEGSMTNEA